MQKIRKQLHWWVLAVLCAAIDTCVSDRNEDHRRLVSNLLRSAADLVIVRGTLLKRGRLRGLDASLHDIKQP